MSAADDESPISHAQFPLGKFQSHLERERERGFLNGLEK